MTSRDRWPTAGQGARPCGTPCAQQRAALSTEIALLIDEKGTVVWSDVHAAQIPADPVGRAFADLLVPGDEDKADRFLRAAQVEGSLSWELGLIGGAGPLTVRFRGAPYGDDTTLIVGAVLPGDYGGLAADAGDLTNQLIVLHRESEQQRRKLAEALESLRQAHATLVEGEKLRSLGLLVASIAHEANNPLAFAVAGIEEADRISQFALALLSAYRSHGGGAAVAMLEADPEAQYLPDLRHTLADARDGMERVRTLVLDLRTFARVEEAEFKLVDLAATLRATLRIGGTAVGVGVRVDLELAELAPLDCAPARLNQAVLNLFTNAVRAASPTGVVRVRLTEVPAGAVLEVEDSGPGVPPALREQVFDLFYTTHTSSGGMGLGLHLARETARAHGGELSVDASDLGGARFRLTLPRSTVARRAVRSHSGKHSAEPHAPFPT